MKLVETIRTFLSVTHEKPYRIVKVEMEPTGEVIIYFAFKNKRASQPFRKYDSDILQDEDLRKNFDCGDLIEISSLASYQKYNTDGMGFISDKFKSMQKQQYKYFPYLVGMAAIVYVLILLMGSRFLQIHIGNDEMMK
jgi:hypothetical protein